MFVSGEEGVSLREMAEVLSLSVTAISQSLEKLGEKYSADTDSALCLLETSNRYRLVTKESYFSLLETYAKTPIHQTLSRAALETLSIIAYKQPITRMEIDEIRGVNSSGALTKLLAFDLIEEAGKKEVIGRPNLYRTTSFFLDYLGINHLEELPQVIDQEMEEETDLFAERTEDADQ